MIQTAAPTHGRRVLLIDDDRDLLLMMTRLLRMLGHQVESAGDGLAGVQSGLASRPEVVLIDLGLPKVDGFEVARRLRQGLGGDVRLIAHTGAGKLDEKDGSWQSAFDAVLVKPVSLQSLKEQLSIPSNS